ncbi:hypothetical protein GC163_11205 [bacterium]|nr:hypothetical protein [bacterium]
MSEPFDVLIVGSGFGGSLAARLCQQIGLRPVLIDAQSHPRFMIGESTTPLANLVLESMADRYHLPWLRPLANYSSWKAAYPQLDVGLKRGFSYFHQIRGEAFTPRADHANELLVAASHGPDDADTHWLRADFDHFLVEQVRAAGIPVFERTRITHLELNDQTWLAQTVTDNTGTNRTLEAAFLIDASGSGNFLAKVLDLPIQTSSLLTHSRAIYGHFRHVRPWEELYVAAGGHVADHPFPCDQAALHHVFDGGWMYQLGFDSGITSAGFSLSDLDITEAPEVTWSRLLKEYPSIGEQFAEAEVISNQGRLIATPRLQRQIGQAAGSNWAMLPNAAGFIDALHSTGNAHTLMGVERLISIFEQHWQSPGLGPALARYDQTLQAELTLIDRIVAGCYRGFRDFPQMVAMSLFYFATAIWSEFRRRSGTDVPTAFLCADEPQLRTAVDQAIDMIGRTDVTTDDVVQSILGSIAPINLAGLGDPQRQNMYPYPQ